MCVCNLLVYTSWKLIQNKHYCMSLAKSICGLNISQSVSSFKKNLCFKPMQNRRRICTQERVCKIACPLALARWNNGGGTSAGDDPTRDAQLGSYQPGYSCLCFRFSASEKKNYNTGANKIWGSDISQPISLAYTVAVVPYYMLNFSLTRGD